VAADLMYWVATPGPADLVDGNVFAHGTARLNLTASDIDAFVAPSDAALVFALRALEPGDGVDAAFPVWMATLRRRDEGPDAIVESVQRVFPQLVDQGSLAALLTGVFARARALGYRKVWLVPRVLAEPLMPPAMKQVAELDGKAFEVVPTSGMMAYPI
jgi:hypothetical protein